MLQISYKSPMWPHYLVSLKHAKSKVEVFGYLLATFAVPLVVMEIPKLSTSYNYVHRDKRTFLIVGCNRYFYFFHPSTGMISQIATFDIFS